MAKRVDFTIRGIDKLEAKLDDAKRLAKVALASAMVEEQEKVMAIAKGQTPVDLGTLRGSGTVLPPDLSIHRIEVIAGFGGAASKYAIFVHENLKAKHKVGKAKFLEHAFLGRAPDMPKNLAKGLERAWKRLQI